MSPEIRMQQAYSLFQQYPQYFPENRRALILRGVVSLGMTPIEARLAGGAFSYQVTPDAHHWPAHSHPLQVMWAQSVQPDASEIRMTFKTATQFPGEGEVAFSVQFEAGRAVNIIRQ